MKKQPKKKRQSKRRPRGNYHLRELPSRRFREDQRVPLRFRTFAAAHLLPALHPFPVSRKFPEKQIDVATRCLQALIKTGLRQWTVRDTCDNSITGVSVRIKIWKVIVKAGFSEDPCPGSEGSQKETRYFATPKLLDLQSQWELGLLEVTELGRNTQMAQSNSPHALVVLKGLPPAKEKRPKGSRRLARPKKKPREERPVLSLTEAIRQQSEVAARCYELSTPEVEAYLLEHFQRMENKIDGVNAGNAKHTWEAWGEDGRSFHVNFHLKQMHSGRLGRAVRLYTWGAQGGQNISKEVRRTMLIDGEPVAELDFSCMLTRMLYHRKGLSPEGDLYHPELIFPKAYEEEPEERELLRTFVKTVTNAWWNSKSRKGAIRQGHLFPQRQHGGR